MCFLALCGFGALAGCRLRRLIYMYVCIKKFLSLSCNISLYTKIMMVNISTIYTIFKLRLFPTIHCKWHQILVKFQKLLGGGEEEDYTAPPPQLKGLAALASLLSNLETPPYSFCGCATATCTRCRGRNCTRDSTCISCKDWSLTQWTTFDSFNARRSNTNRKRSSNRHAGDSTSPIPQSLSSSAPVKQAAHSFAPPPLATPLLQRVLG